ncbi:MAG: tetratricopeptide repeat protein [Chloroherpetonaceae bacterium]|nr:tetratricopeptide repeat protein [Chloroherpetonaceae bacterium]MDW8436959.1 tetratricopeptide repeat protein [Chloroherpetonaceae bacterium]
MNETIEKLERHLSQAQTKLERACAASELAWELRAIDPVRAITISDEAAEVLRSVLSDASALPQTDQFSAQTALATCLRAKAWCVYRLEDYNLAHRLAKDAIAALNKTDDIEGEAYAHLVLGNAAWRLGDYDEALDAFNACLDRARQIENRHLEADALGNIGLVYHNLSDYRASLDYYQRCLVVQREIGDRRGLARTLSQMGAVYFNIADYSNAMECYHRSLNLSQETGDAHGEAIAEANIGDVYFALADYVSALESYQKSLERFRRVNDRRGEAMSLSNIGSAFEKLGDPSKAFKFQTDALEAFRDIRCFDGEIKALMAIGSLREQTGNFEEARELYEKAATLSRRLGDRFAEANALLRQGALLLSSDFQARDEQNAIPLVKEALSIAERIEAREIVCKAHQSLAEAYKRRGEFEVALKHHEEFYRAREAIFNAESDKRLRNLQIAHQLERTRRESELFQKQAEDLKQANDALSAVLIEMERHKKLAEEASLFKTNLLSIAAHDLRNPLSTIVSIADFVQAVLTEVKGGASVTKLAEAEELLKLIHDSAKRMFKLIARILQSAQIESGKFQPSKSLADLYYVAHSVINENRAQAERKEQKINFMGELGAFANVDVECVRDAFENLVSNAIKYTPKGKSIFARLSVAQKPDQNERAIVFAVRDEGQGLTEDDMKRLFGRFERLSARPTGGESSTGLGLSIVKQLVELHGGKVWAESEGKDKGATFYIELPAALQTAEF